MERPTAQGGNALIQLERIAEANQCFRRALALNPAYDLSWNNLGNVLAELKHAAQ